jgi:cobaltochelatase CobS
MANGSAGAPRSRWVHGVSRNANGVVCAEVSATLNSDREVVPVYSLNKWERGRVLKHHLDYPVDVRNMSSDQLYEIIIEIVEGRRPDPPSPSAGSAGVADPSPSSEPVIHGKSSAPSVSAPNVDPGSVEWATVQYVDERVQDVASNANAAISSLVDNVNTGFASMMELVNTNAGPREPSVVTIQLPNVDPVTIAGSHYLLPVATQRAAAGMNQMFVGAAGTGKSWLAHDVARALSVECREISVTVQTQDWRINGANTATSFIRGVARECYEHGGLLLIDEFDNGSPNFLAGLNLLLSSDTYTFADGVTVDRHPQFYVVATANTIGEGGTAQYSARNKMDAAVMDRFTLLFVDEDPSIEENMAATYLVDATERADLLKFVRTVRKNVVENNLRAVITPRAVRDMAIMLANGEAMSVAIRDRITRGCSDEIAAKMLANTGHSW